MDTCFVIQPFDNGRYDKLYEDVIQQAIIDSGLQPYRVDRDPSVSIPIDDIEKGIRKSELCLAEISTDNPNVWFELGIAMAIPKDVVIICSDQRQTEYPFDIRHRKIIKYTTESKRDFEDLSTEITKHLKAIQDKQSHILTAANRSPVAGTQGLSQHEMVTLVTAMQNTFISPDGVSAWIIKQDMNKYGHTDIAISIAIESLLKKQMISFEMSSDINGENYTTYFVTEKGKGWLLENQDKLVLKKEVEQPDEDGDELPPF